MCFLLEALRSLMLFSTCSLNKVELDLVSDSLKTERQKVCVFVPLCAAVREKSKEEVAAFFLRFR